jgi:transposase
MSSPMVDDALWDLIAPLLPQSQRRSRHPGRKRLDDRKVLGGILFVFTTGIAWQRLPQELGYGSGMTCWRRLRDWQQAGVFERLHSPTLRGSRSSACSPPPTVRTSPSSSRSSRRSRPSAASAAGPDDARRSSSPTAATTHSRTGRNSARPRHPTDHRQAEHSARLRTRWRTLGCRTHPRLAAPVPTPPHPLRTPSRHPPSLPHTRLQPHLLPTNQAILLGALMEPRGCNQWQPVATGPSSKTAESSGNRCHRLRPVAASSAW